MGSSAHQLERERREAATLTGTMSQQETQSDRSLRILRFKDGVIILIERLEDLESTQFGEMRSDQVGVVEYLEVVLE
jgi:hypothetical protein